MPKSGAGKITWRMIASISNVTDIREVVTPANPEIVDGFRHQVQT
jgi:hypothetical protein